jgi:4-hydroxyphenylpyruvate dioxygenase
MPAVRGVGGSLIYFLDASDAASVWQTEFEELPRDQSAAGAGLKRIDHFAQSMQYEDMLSWLLYYVALLDVNKSAPIEIADPVGLVLSQAMESSDGRFRVVLNGSAAAQTLVSRFLNAYGGAGVQHIAFSTDDIFETAEKLRSLGMEFLSIPTNYYGDLAAQFDFDDAVVERMAKFNILYDQDADGEYHHLYARAFAKRFFFEVVQRRGYKSYGARNTSIRLAAQSRFKALPPTADPAHQLGSAS